MSEGQTILVFGIPGAGKTTLIKKVVNVLDNCVRVSGGSLINAEISDAERDRLRQLGEAEVLFNQNLLVHNFKKYRDENPKVDIIFDGHCIVKDGNKVVQIPVNVIKGLSPCKIFFLDEHPEVILTRRTEDTTRPDREKETIEEIEKLRALQISICQKYEEKTGVPLVILKSSSAEEFLEQIP